MFCVKPATLFWSQLQCFVWSQLHYSGSSSNVLCGASSVILQLAPMFCVELASLFWSYPKCYLCSQRIISEQAPMLSVESAPSLWCQLTYFVWSQLNYFEARSNILFGVNFNVCLFVFVTSASIFRRQLKCLMQSQLHYYGASSNVLFGINFNQFVEMAPLNWSQLQYVLCSSGVHSIIFELALMLELQY